MGTRILDYMDFPYNPYDLLRNVLQDFVFSLHVIKNGEDDRSYLFFSVDIRRLNCVIICISPHRILVD